ncbi:MAG: transglutaminase-like cysteine peptidase [Sulfurospirillaceae bacterium]|nr:transglutaminase-like cysteine peptidase [Sulfurospirillaceae bacterium]
MKERYGTFAVNRFLALEKLTENLKDAPLKKRLEEVNDFWNQVRYASDKQVWHTRDYWASPWEFLAKDKGDCEDYAIAKYFTLKKLGVDTKKMYFIYVVVKKRREPHMVLGIYEKPNSIPLILDSINYKIFPASQRQDLLPVYIFNGDTLYRYRNKSSNNLKNKTQFVKKKWDDLIEKIKRNQI